MKAAIRVLGAALLLIALAACQGAYLMEIIQAQMPLSSAKAITTFSFASPAATGTIDENAKTIAITVPYGTKVTTLVATFSTTGSSVKVGSTVQVSATTTNDFRSPISARAIAAFSFASPASTGVIDENAKTIAVTVPYGTNVTALVSTFTTTGSSVKVGSMVQVSGATANDFRSPITYTVTAADGSTASYTVTGTVGAWQTVGTAGFSADGAQYVCLAIDSSGTPYVAYQDSGNSNKATVMKYAGGSWQTVGTAGFTAGGAAYTSLYRSIPSALLMSPIRTAETASKPRS